METQPENQVEGAIITRYHDPVAYTLVKQAELTEAEATALEEEYKDYDFSKDEEWYSVPEFMMMINEGMIHWDWGGICRVTVDGRDSNYHLGIWMLHKENEKSIPVTFYDLAERDETIMLEWANK